MNIQMYLRIPNIDKTKKNYIPVKIIQGVSKEDREEIVVGEVVKINQEYKNKVYLCDVRIFPEKEEFVKSRMKVEEKINLENPYKIL